VSAEKEKSSFLGAKRMAIIGMINRKWPIKSINPKGMRARRTKKVRTPMAA
jgi:hypothetical protein